MKKHPVLLYTFSCVYPSDGRRGCFFEDDKKVNTRINNDVTFEFKCSEVISNHNKYRGAIYSHKNKKYESGNGWGMSLEKSWNTSRSEIRCFYFVIIVCKINYFLAYCYFTNSKMELL